MPCVTFQPSGTSIEVGEGASVLEAALEAGATEIACCGITAACGACRMSVLAGEENLTPPDALEAGHRARHRFLPFERLACMAHVRGPVEVELVE
ncbi:MAG: 2Fe-2S iron-sulfur cluster-binding protein [Myxococcota bacterium]